jgi:hypothetical protein
LKTFSTILNIWEFLWLHYPLQWILRALNHAKLPIQAIYFLRSYLLHASPPVFWHPPVNILTKEPIVTACQYNYLPFDTTTIFYQATTDNSVRRGTPCQNIHPNYLLFSSWISSFFHSYLPETSQRSTL